MSTIDEEGTNGEDHGVPAELLELHEVLEYEGKVVPPGETPDVFGTTPGVENDPTETKRKRLQ